MKKFTFLFVLVLLSFSIFADAGNAYRYKVKIALKDHSELSGYFFFATLEKGFNPDETDFKSYLFSCYNFPIALYSNLKTIQVNEYLTIDFAIAGSDIKINKEEIEAIELIEEIATPVGSRLIELSEQEFDNLNQDFITSERIHNESYLEHCSYYLLNWNQSNNLVALKKDIYERIDKLRLENDYEAIHDYITILKHELIEKKIIFFQYCSAL